MSLMNVFDIAGSGMKAQSMRLNAVASNLANAESATSSSGQPYRGREVVFQAMPLSSHVSPAATGVRVIAVVENPAPPRLIYSPSHPLANGAGYLEMPNVNVAEEMVNMISASRSFQNNASAMNAAKTLLQRLLTIAQA